MPLLDIQRRGRELGRIRLGQQVQAKNGKMRPEKLSTFRFTTNSRAGADAVAQLLGGEVRAWEGGTQQWEVITPTSELPVMIPPGDAVIRQDYEMWSGGGCQRRCDSQTAHTRDEQGNDVTGPCLCPADAIERSELAKVGRACKPTTRLNVMLPDLPDIGVWRVESHGFYAAVELGGAAELLVKARDKGVFLPALLRLDKRRSAVPGRSVREWYVPVLEIGASVRELTSGEAGGNLQQALPPAPVRALAAGASSPSPVAPSVAAGEDHTEADLAPEQHEPAGAGMSAQQIADRARGTRSKAMLDALGRTASELEVLDDFVDDGSGVMSKLRDVLTERLDTVKAAS